MALAKRRSLRPPPKPKPLTFRRRLWTLGIGLCLFVIIIISSYFVISKNSDSKVASNQLPSVAKPSSASRSALFGLTEAVDLADLSTLVVSTEFKIAAAITALLLIALVSVLIWYFVPSPFSDDLNDPAMPADVIDEEKTKTDAHSQLTKDGQNASGVDEEEEDQMTTIIIGACVSFVVFCLLLAGGRYAFSKCKGSECFGTTRSHTTSSSNGLFNSLLSLFKRKDGKGSDVKKGAPITDPDVFELSDDPAFDSGFFSKYEKPVRFKKERKIGGGSQGNVFLVHPLEDEKCKFAMKVTNMVNDSDKVNFEHELEALKVIPPHKTIVTPYWISSPLLVEPYIIMEYLELGTIGRIRLKFDSSKDKGIAAYIAKSVLEALHHLHGEGFIHKDLTSHNIGISENGDIKLIDFGDTGKTPTLCGLYPFYKFRAAEEFTKDPNDPQIKYKSDVYGLGVTLTSLTDSPHFGVPKEIWARPVTLWAHFQSVKATHIPLPKLITDNLKEDDDYILFLKRCLDFDPIVRASVDELLNDPFMDSAVSREEFLKFVS